MPTLQYLGSPSPLLKDLCSLINYTPEVRLVNITRIIDHETQAVWIQATFGRSACLVRVNLLYLFTANTWDWPGVRAATQALKEKFGIDQSGGHAPLFTEDWDA